MRARVSSLSGRFLPNGVLDVFVQVALMEATYMAYRLVRGWIDDPTGAAVAFQNGRSVIHIEQTTPPVGLVRVSGAGKVTSVSGNLVTVALDDRRAVRAKAAPDK